MTVLISSAQATPKRNEGHTNTTSLTTVTYNLTLDVLWGTEWSSKLVRANTARRSYVSYRTNLLATGFCMDPESTGTTRVVCCPLYCR